MAEVTVERVETAGARRAAAAVRVEQVRDRLARLRAGEPTSHDDVRRAREAATNQQAEATRAEARLRRTRSEAAGLRRRWFADIVDPRDEPRQGRDDSAGASSLSTTRAENRVLRRALVAIAADDEVVGGWAKERREELWEALGQDCGAPSWRGWSDALCCRAGARVPGLRGTAVSSFDGDDVPHLLAVSDAWTRELEEVTELVGEGPAVEAQRTQLPVLVRDLGERQARWPGYASAILALGVRSVYAVPVTLGSVVLGALTLYPHDQSGKGWPGWTNGLYLAAVATRTLLADLDAVEQGLPSGELTGDRVQLATGILASSLRVSVEEASLRLRAYAFGNARPLGDVAQDVVEGTLRHL